jgi:multidrug transporter EmrE-like cation transporter
MKINNKWNILFIAYLLPAIILSAILNKNVLPKNEKNNEKNNENNNEKNNEKNNNIDSTNETDKNKENKENKENKWNKDVIFLLLGNAIIGALGYYLRFYTIEKLPVVVYSSLSYFGIIMAYFYGWELNKETLDWKKAIGSLLIILSGIVSNI